MKYILTIMGIIILDQISKIYVSLKIKEKEKIVIIEDKFYITNVKNKGAAYGFLKNDGDLLYLLTAAAFLWIMDLFRNLAKNGETTPLIKLSFAFIIGGGLGNIIDRIHQKYVTDFIFIKFSKKAPIFNFADLFIFVGAILFFVSRAKKVIQQLGFHVQ